jgi:hypothetical protein
MTNERGAEFPFDRVVVAIALAIAVLHSAWALRFASMHSHFVNEDLRSFWRSLVQPFWHFVLAPLDDHFVPLHRLVSYVILRLAPMNFTVALGVLGAVHLATLFVLLRILDGLRRSPWNGVLVALYSLQATFGSQFLWWTAGLHRLPCVLFSTLAVHFYLRFRRERARRWILLAALSNAAALGFYSKGILVPLHLAAVEVALADRPAAKLARGNWLGIAALLPVAMAYLPAWWLWTTPGWHASNLDPWFHARFVALAAPLFAETALGLWLDGSAAALAVTLVVWGAAIAYSAIKSPRALIAWGALAVCFAAHMSLIASSGVRGRWFGLSSVLLERYYFDAAFLVPIFAGIAFQAAAQAPAIARPAAIRWAVAAGGLSGLFALEACSRASLRRIQAYDGDFRAAFESVQKHGHATAGSYYPLHEASRRFILALQASVARLPEADRLPLDVKDTKLPWYVVPWGETATHSADLLILMGEQVKLGNPGRYVVTSSGDLVDSGDAAR